MSFFFFFTKINILRKAAACCCKRGAGILATCFRFLGEAPGRKVQRAPFRAFQEALKVLRYSKALDVAYQMHICCREFSESPSRNKSFPTTPGRIGWCTGTNLKTSVKKTKMAPKSKVFQVPEQISGEGGVVSQYRRHRLSW